MVGRFFSALPVRPRTAIALALLAVVGVVIVIGKLIGGEAPQSFPDGSSQVSTVDPTTGNDSVVNIDPSPSLKQQSSGQTALTVATAFAENWIKKNRSASAWRNSLQPLSTKTLTGELAQSDPISVPAQRLSGQATTEVHAETSADVIFPTDAGKLRLRLVFVAEGRWLVDGIDWERA
ncbi:hypothetical protein Rhe02_64190 [Rhizocola hellebori]|uniref:Uncharacterized protein n=1 Tax=Rhizocola hellebori TaxID=1392758 RepID=A0A8J3VJE3_9ACTN|nr:hypothetical protein [Rhizocola hellebori]GIH08352.1 hypothetical protein Rhe02_64190 [Rhizocola hellebori]